MKGCKNCPAYAKCTVSYRGSACAALRSTYGLDNDPEFTTNADRIRAMSDEELACFIKKLAYNREPPWGDLFQETFCKGCPAQEYTMENGQKMRLRECDFADGECPHGSDIAWWLQQPAEGDRYEGIHHRKV